jgi:hypothetical protein
MMVRSADREKVTLKIPLFGQLVKMRFDAAPWTARYSCSPGKKAWYNKRVPSR